MFVQQLEYGELNITEAVITSLVAGVIGHTAGVSKVEGVVAPFLERLRTGKPVDFIITDDLVVNVNLRMEYGVHVPTLAQAVQQEVLSELEKWTGLRAKAVNIKITGLSVMGRCRIDE